MKVSGDEGVGVGVGKKSRGEGVDVGEAWKKSGEDREGDAVRGVRGREGYKTNAIGADLEYGEELQPPNLLRDF